MSRPQRILLTGASGYVGGRLLKRLERSGHRIRCLARRPEFTRTRAGEGTEVVGGNVLEPETLAPAFEGVDAAYYLVHSMGESGRADFEEQDRLGAHHFAEAARRAGVRRVVYLGGLGDEAAELSPHLRSRHEVGRVLRESQASVIELRASIVLGSGSLSYEMLRALVERLPVMVTPRWVSLAAQPIAIDDLLGYLEEAIELDTDESRVYEIGGSERMSYGELMREYARQRGLRRWMIPVPLLTPRLSGLWLGLVTPLYARVGRTLVESICHETVVNDDRARHDFAVQPMGVAEALRRAFANEDREFAETRWSDALSAGGADPESFRFGGERHGLRLVDSRTTHVSASAERAFVPVRRIGGRVGWYAYDLLWRLRGWVDLLLGGVGLRRGRRDPEHPRVGDPLDWWRVEVYEPGRRLRLRAEMKVPGRAWLEFEVTPDPAPGAGATIRQTAEFDPGGLLGLVYWYGIYPLHLAVFRGMLRGIARAAEAEGRASRAS